MSDRIIRLERYLHGQMSEAERRQFEQDMTEDPMLQRDVQHMRIIDSALDVSIEDALRSQLKDLERKATYEAGSVRKALPLYSRLAIAAGILVLVAAGMWLLLGKESNASTAFAENHWIAYDFHQVRGDQVHGYDVPVDMTRTTYDRQAAADWFITWLASHPRDHEARFLLANILRELKKPEEAKIQLARIMEDSSIIWGEKAEWNYVLLCLESRWDEKSEAIFQKILEDPNHSYNSLAKKWNRLRPK